jgi:dimethylhistidine N-methyltransferase
MRPSVASPDPQAAADSFASDVEYYLSLEPRQLPSRYLYDALGSALFDAICELPWYRVTHAEFGLLKAHGSAMLTHASEIRRQPGSPLRIVELGPGNGTKLLTLLDADAASNRSRRLPSGRGRREVHLVDVSATALHQAAHALSSLDDVEVVPHVATYEDGLREIADGADAPGRTLVLFLGSNIGNFDRPGAEEFLRTMRAALNPGDDLLIGADLVKPEAELLLAYDDPLGVTAAFNRNLLVRINRELGGDFRLDGFSHRALWNADESRVEMHLVSRRRQRVTVPAAHIDIALAEGDTIWTESSYKYEPAELETLLGGTGFASVGRWIADEERFAVFLARAA